MKALYLCVSRFSPLCAFKYPVPTQCPYPACPFALVEVVGQLIENGKGQAWLIDIVEQSVLPGGGIPAVYCSPYSQ